MRERQIQTQILHFLRSKKILAFEVKNTATYDRRLGRYRKPHGLFIKGVADVIGVLPGGRFLAIEVKSKTGRVRPEQEIFLTDVIEHGGIALVARSLEDVELWWNNYSSQGAEIARPMASSVIQSSKPG